MEKKRLSDSAHRPPLLRQRREAVRRVEAEVRLLRAEYANLRAGRRSCAAFPEHRVKTTDRETVTTAGNTAEFNGMRVSRVLVGMHESVFCF